MEPGKNRCFSCLFLSSLLLPLLTTAQSSAESLLSTSVTLTTPATSYSGVLTLSSTSVPTKIVFATGSPPPVAFLTAPSLSASSLVASASSSLSTSSSVSSNSSVNRNTVVSVLVGVGIGAAFLLLSGLLAAFTMIRRRRLRAAERRNLPQPPSSSDNPSRASTFVNPSSYVYNGAQSTSKKQWEVIEYSNQSFPGLQPAISSMNASSSQQRHSGRRLQSTHQWLRKASDSTIVAEPKSSYHAHRPGSENEPDPFEFDFVADTETEVMNLRPLPVKPQTRSRPPLAVVTNTEKVLPRDANSVVSAAMSASRISLPSATSYVCDFDAVSDVSSISRWSVATEIGPPAAHNNMI